MDVSVLPRGSLWQRQTTLCPAKQQPKHREHSATITHVSETPPGNVWHHAQDGWSGTLATVVSLPRFSKLSRTRSKSHQKPNRSVASRGRYRPASTARPNLRHDFRHELSVGYGVPGLPVASIPRDNTVLPFAINQTSCCKWIVDQSFWL